jgi:release factor glutamine methyltransferase
MNYLSILNYGNKILKSKKITSYKLDTELILAKVLNKSREEILTNLNLTLKEKDFYSFKKLLIRRKKNEPMAYIFKQKDFWKYKFFVNKDVLIPRPETEIIIEEVLKLTKHNSSRLFLDVGTGSGCLIISIIKERPNSYGTAIDISKKAIDIAVNNAKMHHLENKIKFLNIDIDKFIANKYDFIVSNPPYINNTKFKRLEINVKQFEPTIALKAGVDGLKIIEKLILKSKKLLKNNGKLIFEIGENQEGKVRKLLMKNKFCINRICKDIRSWPRVVVSTKIF